VRGWEVRFEDLVSQRGPALCRYAYLLCGDADQASDLVQEGLLRAFSRFGRGGEVEELEPYVKRCILSAFLDAARRGQRWRRVAHLFSSSELAFDQPDVHEQSRVGYALAALSPRQRSCVVLRYYEDLAVDEIAARLGCGTGSVKRYLHDASQRLRGILEERVSDHV
jgi:RNA polymerase sigma factor (sigma-70 family)